MRAKENRDGLTVNAIAGTHVVLLGLDLNLNRQAGCLGFAIRRTDHTEGEEQWMRGLKTFEAVEPALDPGLSVSTRQHPIQSFQWADYAAKPEHSYTYTVVALYGEPAALTEGATTEVKVATEGEGGPGDAHAVFFNRGAIASQEYARRFANRSPDVVGERAYRWLSRGLEEALLRFIARANGPSFALFGAFYELQWPSVLQACRAATATGATVHLIYDGIDKGNGPKALNEEALEAAGVPAEPRTRGSIMHNKFLVLTQENRPVAVWTGSTNITENGLFGHLNCGHQVDDPAVAGAYLVIGSNYMLTPLPMH